MDSDPEEDILDQMSNEEQVIFDLGSNDLFSGVATNEDGLANNQDPGTATGQFKWVKESDHQKFTPVVGQFASPGIKFNVDVSSDTPWTALKHLLDDDIMDDLVTETNRFVDQIKIAKQGAMKTWKTNLTREELWRFLGLKILTGIIRKPNIKEYWSIDKVLETPIFPATMPRDRFLDIHRALHFSDNESPHDPTDRLFKLGNFMPRLLRNFEKSINCGEYLCVDESLLLFKGKLSFKQYIPSKRSRFGIKYFALVDNETKMVVKIVIYLGKSTNIGSRMLVKDFGYGGATVLHLLEGYLNKNHKLVVDNYFNSPKLLEHLLTKNTYALGTVRKSRQGMPKFTKKLQKGECEAQFCNGLLLERWNDRREVFMLNSYIQHQMKPTTSTNPVNSRAKPQTVLEYNAKMGGVDYVDKQLSPYKIVRKTIKWYKKFAFHLIEMSLHNAFVMYKSAGHRLTFKKFIENLVKEIIEKTPGKKPRARAVRGTNRPGVQHLPVKNLKPSGKVSNSDCALCKGNGKRKQTPFSCQGCGKRLCIDGPDSCFKIFHENGMPSRKRARVRHSSSSQTTISGTLSPQIIEETDSEDELRSLISF